MDQVAGFRDHGYAMPLMLMADLVADQYRVKGTPGVVVTDRSHRIAWVRSSGPPPKRSKR
jgi:hypothetical protein